MTLQNNYSFLLRYAYPLFGLFAGSIFLITASVDTTDVPTVQLLPLMLLQRIALIFPVTFLLLAPILNEKTPHNILKKVLLWASIITAIFIVSELIILVSYSGALTMSIPMSTAFSLTFVYFSILVFTQNYLVNPYNPFDSQLTFQSINRLASTITVQLLFVGTVMLCMALLFALLTFVNVPQEVFLNMAVWISIGTIASTVGISIGKKQVFFSRAIEQLTKLFFHIKLPFVGFFLLSF